MLLFQFEGVGEEWVAADDFASLRGHWLTHPDVDAVSVELSRDGALTEAQMTGSASFVSAPWRYERIEGAGRFGTSTGMPGADPW